MLDAALTNLLHNAWKFTGKTARARIEVGVEESGGERVFFVRDNGVGFDMARAARLFAAFERLHAAGEFEGTGLGLVTVQRIIQRHRTHPGAGGARPGRELSFHPRRARGDVMRRGPGGAGPYRGMDRCRRAWSGGRPAKRALPQQCEAFCVPNRDTKGSLARRVLVMRGFSGRPNSGHVGCRRRGWLSARST